MTTGENWISLGLILGPILFNILISNVNKNVGKDSKCTFCKSVDDSKLRMAGTLVDGASVQTDLVNLESWTNRKFTEFLHLGQGNPMHQYRLDANCLDSSPSGRTWWVIINIKPNMSQQFGLITKQNSQFCRKVAGRLKEVVMTFCVTLLSQIWITSSSFGFFSSTEMLRNWKGLAESYWELKALEHMTCQKRLREIT